MHLSTMDKGHEQSVVHDCDARNIPCIDSSTGKGVNIEDPVTVCGPFTKAQAHARANQLNTAHRETAEGEPFYAPVTNAPAFLDQTNWNEYWVVVPR